MACTDENKQNCIIFWNYNPELSIGYLDRASFSECIEKFPNYIKIGFSEIEYFDEECQVLVLKEEIDTLKFGEQYRNSKNGRLFASIIIDNAIVLNCVNGSVFALLLPSDKYPEIGKDKYLIEVKEKRNIIITDSLSFDVYTKRDTLNKDVKKLIKEKMKKDY